MNPVLRSAAARALSFVPSTIATLAASRLIIQHYGVATFDSYALILTLVNLIPFNDMGVGAAVTFAYAADGPHSQHSRRVTRTAVRVLAVSTLCTAAAAVLVGRLDAWRFLLGSASGPAAWCTVAVAIYAVSFVPGLGYSALLGVNRNHVAILVQAFYPVIVVLFVAGVLAAGGSGVLVLAAVPAALVLNNLILSAVSTKIARINWFRVVRQALRPRRFPGTSTRAIAGPMLITTLVTPIALQSDRIVLSYVSTPQALANYSVLFQIIAPALALIAASSQPLWPMYTAARASGEAGPRLSRVLMLFCCSGAVMAAILGLLAEPLAQIIGSGHVKMGFALPFAGALCIVVAAASYPLAMYLMDPAGIRVVALCSLVALPLNVGLSIALARHLGGSGPLFASFVIGLVVQVLPAILYIGMRRPPGRHRRDERAQTWQVPVARKYPQTSGVARLQRADPAAER